MENPFESPQSVQAIPLSGARPLSATLFGVLNIVFAVFSFCGNVFGGIVLALILYDLIPNFPSEEILSQNPALASKLNLVNIFLSTLLSVVLLFSGIGLLKFKPWGRSLSNFYAICSLVLIVLALIAHVVFVVLPLMRNENLPQGQDEAAALGGAIGGAIGGFVGGCIGVIYPILLLIFMNLRPFRERIGA